MRFTLDANRGTCSCLTPSHTPAKHLSCQPIRWSGKLNIITSVYKFKNTTLQAALRNSCESDTGVSVCVIDTDIMKMGDRSWHVRKIMSLLESLRCLLILNNGDMQLCALNIVSAYLGTSGRVRYTEAPMQHNPLPESAVSIRGGENI